MRVAQNENEIERVMCGDGKLDRGGKALSIGQLFGSTEKSGGKDTSLHIDSGSTKL